MIVKLQVIHGRPAGKQLFFGPGEYYLGRGPECHVRFNTDWISRQHCLLRVEGDRAFLRDLSRHGTLVNGQLIAHDQTLGSGDLVQIGPVVFQVELVASNTIIPTPGSSVFFSDGSGCEAAGAESTAQKIAKGPLQDL